MNPPIRVHISGSKQAMNSPAVVEFSKHMALKMRKGLNKVQAMRSFKPNDASFAKAFKTILEDYDRGFKLAEALTGQPAHFNDEFCNAVQWGDETNTLQAVFEQFSRG
ncbi:MAG: type II secretion system F family protein [Candidatus Andersenbacteria bacterium]